MNYDELARIVERAKLGDEEAFAQLFIEFSKSIYYTALRMTKNEHDAHDVVQETMIALHKNLQSIRDAKSTVAYVNKIASRQALRLLRKRIPEYGRDDTEDALHNTAQENGDFIPEEYIAQKEKREYIVSMIDELTDTQRTAILLFYYKQLSIKQIAETLEVDESAIKMRLSRARAVLREKVKNSTSNLIQGTLSMSVLARIFEINADEIYTSEISTGLWVEVAEKLSLPVTALVAATVSAIPATGSVSAITSGATGTTCTSYTSGSVLSSGLVPSSCSVSSSVVLAAPVTTVATIVLTCLATLAITAGLWFGGIISPHTEDIVLTKAISYIAFSGGPFEGYTNINPTHAEVTSENIHGELVPHHWWIITLDSREYIHSGGGGTVDKTLNEMIEHGENGEYVLFFLMEDRNGNMYEVSRQFSVISGS